MRIGTLFLGFLFALLILPISLAATLTVSQSGADSGTVMKGQTFTITVSDLSGSGSVNLIDLPSGFSSGEGTSKSFSEGITSVTWTTPKISQIQTNIKIKASISVAGSPSTAESDPFDVVLPPSISLSVLPTSVTVNKSSTYTFTLNIQNSGGTSAKSVGLSVSGTGMSVSSGCSAISSIAAGGSSSATCTVLASTVGTISTTFTAAPSNCDSKSDEITVTVSPVCGDGVCDVGETFSNCPDDCEEEDDNGGTPGGGGYITPPKEKPKNATKKLELIPGVGLRNNTKLQAAIEKVLAKGKMSDQAKENLLRLSASIISDLEVTREFKTEQNKSRLSIKIKYKGNKTAKNFIIYDSVPKSFANSSDLITVTALGATIEIVNKDPEYLFIYSEVLPDQDIIVTYEVSGEKDAGLINDTSVEFYTESLEELIVGDEIEKICTGGEKRCFDNKLQECRDNKWIIIEICKYGCNSTSLICNPKLTEEIDKKDFWLYILAGVIILIVVVVSLEIGRIREARNEVNKKLKELKKLETQIKKLKSEGKEVSGLENIAKSIRGDIEYKMLVLADEEIKRLKTKLAEKSKH